MYANTAQADLYVERYYSSTNPLRVAWSLLSGADKEVLLNRAEQQIDQLPLLGRPITNAKEFPREPFASVSLQQAQVATIELAVQGQNEASLERAQMQRDGVRSFRLGDLSETFVNKQADAASKLVYSIVYPHLRKWLSGGYSICATAIRK